MKMLKFFMGVIVALAFSACSSNDDVLVDNPTEDEDSRFMAVTIRNAQDIMGRAAGDQTASGDLLYEEGLDAENNVKSVRFYFFKADGTPAAVKTDKRNYYDCEEIEETDQTAMPNVEKILSAIIVIQTPAGDNIEDLNSMVAICNPPTSELGENPLSLEELRKKVGDYAVEGKYSASSQPTQLFVLTSSVFGSATEKYKCEVEIKSSDIKTSKEDAQNAPVNVYVERAVAKVRVATKWAEGVVHTDDVSYEGGTYTAVQLKEKKNDTAPVIIDGKPVYAMFMGWGLQTVAPKSYLFKKVDSNWSLGWTWNNPASFRSYWAINPEEVKAETLIHYEHSKATAKIGTRTHGVGDGDYNGDFIYCQENAADWDSENGYKNKYGKGNTAANAISTRTKAYIAAKLVTIDGITVTPLTLSEWGGQKYAGTENLKTAMVNAVSTQVYYRIETGTENTPEGIKTTYEYKSIDPSFVKITDAEHTLLSVTEEGGKKVYTYRADKNTESSKRYLSYIQLVDEKDITFPEKSDGKFYDVYHNEMNRDEVNILISSMPGAKLWDGGQTYYYIDIVNAPSVATEDPSTRYGVVRNHIYDIEINSVTGLGTPVYNPDGSTEEVIIPQHPENDESYLGARINILSWRVVRQKVDLEW